jgi:hypothetical protein
MPLISPLHRMPYTSRASASVTRAMPARSNSSGMAILTGWAQSLRDDAPELARRDANTATDADDGDLSRSHGGPTPGVGHVRCRTKLRQR